MKGWLQSVFRRLGKALALFIGATLIGFILIVQFGPDLAFEKIAKNTTQEEIDSVREQLGYNQPLIERYGRFLGRLVVGDLGRSAYFEESNNRLLARTVPISLQLLIPGFVAGNLLGIILAMWAAWHRGQWLDRFITGLSVFGMSISFPVAIIAAQVLFSSESGFGWFPVQGWEADGFVAYWRYVAVPSIALIIVTLGYNTRFYRAVMVEELEQDYVLAARAFGAGPLVIMLRHVLLKALVPILTRVLFSMPSLVIGGSLLLEKFFAIPGVGRVTYDAVMMGDQSLMLAIVALTALLFVIVNQSIDACYRWADPRLRTRAAS